MSYICKICGTFNMFNNGICIACGTFGSLRACVPKLIETENSRSNLRLLKTIERGANSKVSRFGMPKHIITFPQKYEDDELTTKEKQKTFLTAAAKEFLRIEIDQLEKSMESD